MSRFGMTLAAAIFVAAGPLSACAAVDGDPATAKVRPGDSATVAQPETSALPAVDGGEPDWSELRELPPAVAEPQPIDRGPAPTAVAVRGLEAATGAIVPIGVEPTGELEVPGPTEVGWYQFGAAPGNAGSTVLAAHIAFDGVDGVFRNLAEVEIGTEVQIVLADGGEASYRVTSVETYRKTALPVDEVFTRVGPERLVLISCGGTFDPARRSYDSNVVAWAVPAD